MDVLKWIAQLFEEYGYGVLFFGLLLEFIALPFPGETTMAYAGYLSYAGTLDFSKLRNPFQHIHRVHSYGQIK
jgi:membrane protein DedA with SNARE-associated domain